MTSIDELQKALNNRPLEHICFEGLTIDNIVRTRDQRRAVLRQLREWQEWFENFEGLFSAFQKGFEKCEYVNAKGEAAFLCAPCRNYHGFKRGCEWKVSGVEEKKESPTQQKFRCSEFGNANSSDACLQCPSNNECATQTCLKAKGSVEAEET